MSLLEWSDFYESGNDLIDNQHQQLLKAINSYRIGCQFKVQEKATYEFNLFLQQFIQYHFQAEEAFQKTSCYPDFRKHQASHDMICIQLKNIGLKLDATDYSKEMQQEFYTLIYNCINVHLTEEDIPFCKFYKNYQEMHAG
jgi:hemerythrin-like metal-binding protein